MDSFGEYIESLKAHLPITADKIHIIMGNESCDLDSTVSSLTLAYFLHKTRSDPSVLVLPILNVPENEFPLRTENVYVLYNIGVKKESLLFRDSIQLNEIITEKCLEVTLVDHHVLSEHFQFLKDNVRQIFDHRPLDVTANWGEDVRLDLQLVGSCCTLVANEMLSKRPDILTPTVGKVLYETIVFDTIGLSHEAGKVQELDIQLCKQLEQLLKITPNHKSLFDDLWAAHNDVSHLTPNQLLAKDLKIVENILIPGLPMLVRDFLAYCDVLEFVKQFCLEKNCNYMILMGLEAKGGIAHRDIAFYSHTKGSVLLDYVIEKLKTCKELHLEQESCDISEIRYFRQHCKPSRKQIIPLVKEALQELK